MAIWHRLLALIIFLYITGKWIGTIAGILAIIGFFSDSGAIALLTGFGWGVIAVVVGPLIVISILEWVIFGKLTWSYNSFSKKEE